MNTLNFKGQVRTTSEKRLHYRRIFRKCVEDVISLEAAGRIFSALSEKKRDREEHTQLEVERTVQLNLLLSAKVYVKESTLLFKLLRHHGWKNGAFQDGLNVQQFRNSLATLYMALKPISTIEDQKSDNLALSYCPTLLLKHLKRQLELSSDASMSKLEFTGACLFADISGFTKLSSEYSSKGPTGLDDLHILVNEFIGKLVEVVYSFGGDGILIDFLFLNCIIDDVIVIAFAGDAIICVFDNDDNTSACIKAVLCSQALINSSNLFAWRDNPLRSHIALGYGHMSLGTLDGLEGHWVYLLNGECLSQMHECLDDAALGQIVVTPQCFQELLIAVKKSDESDMKVIEKPSRNVLIEKLIAPFDMAHPSKRLNDTIGTLSDSELAALCSSASRFVPPPALAAIQQRFFPTMNELNEVTTLFLDLTSYSIQLNRDPLSLAPFFKIIQRCLLETRGFLRQFLIDDKGCVVIAMWGLSSYSYENNAVRALICATMISKECNDINLFCSIGITSGSVYCGNIGSSFRRDYVGIGSAVNLAARLMSKAYEKIFIDANTFNRIPTAAQHQLVQGPSLHLKGLPNPVEIFVYASFSPFRASVETALSDSHIFVSETVKTQLSNQLQKSTKSAVSKWGRVRQEIFGTVVYTIIVGAEGISRSAAADYFYLKACECNFDYIYRLKVKEGDKVLVDFFLKDLVLQILNNLMISSEIDQRAYFTRIFQDENPNFSSFAIDVMVDKLRRAFDMKWVDLSSQYHGYQRSLRPIESEGVLYSGEKMLSREKWLAVVLTGMLKPHKTAVIVEDIQYLDEVSLRVLERIQSKSLNLSVLLTMTRADSEDEKISVKKRRAMSILNILAKNKLDLFTEDDAYYSITCHDNCTLVSLPDLSVEECEDMVKSILNEKRNPFFSSQSTGVLEVARKVFEISEANPFWCSVIVTFIRDYGVAKFEKAYTAFQEKKNQSLAGTGVSAGVIDSFVIARLKTMSTDSQTTAKWASIFGKEFSKDDLYSILPTQCRTNLSNILNFLVNQSFICLQSNKVPVSYVFVNASIRQAIYNSITPADTARYHHVLAEYFCKKYSELPDNLTIKCATLSHHYMQSLLKFPVNRHNALKYTLNTAQSALSTGRFRDCLFHCKNAARIAKDETEREFITKLADSAVIKLSEVRNSIAEGILERQSAIKSVLSKTSDSGSPRLDEDFITRFNFLAPDIADQSLSYNEAKRIPSMNEINLTANSIPAHDEGPSALSIEAKQINDYTHKTNFDAIVAELKPLQIDDRNIPRFRNTKNVLRVVNALTTENKAVDYELCTSPLTVITEEKGIRRFEEEQRGGAYPLSLHSMSSHAKLSSTKLGVNHDSTQGDSAKSGCKQM